MRVVELVFGFAFAAGLIWASWWLAHGAWTKQLEPPMWFAGISAIAGLAGFRVALWSLFGDDE